MRDAIVVQLSERDSGLDDGIGVLCIDFDDSVHTVEVEGYGASDAWCRAAISVSQLRSEFHYGALTTLSMVD